MGEGRSAAFTGRLTTSGAVSGVAASGGGGAAGVAGDPVARGVRAYGAASGGGGAGGIGVTDSMATTSVYDRYCKPERVAGEIR